MLGETAQEVERITHNLGPNVLEHLGLVAALGDTGTEFKARTGIPVRLVCTLVTPRLPADVELAFLRILQEALRNVEKHAAARRIVVRLSKKRGFVRLAIRDDGAGFDTDQSPGAPESKGRLGLLSMRERAASVGGTLRVRSVSGAGTEVEALIPVAPKA
jgi:two-component system NarL family sensor kinase